MRVEVRDVDGAVVHEYPAPTNYKATIHYKQLAAGDGHTFDGLAAFWVYIDDIGREVETIPAPAYR